MSSMDYQPFPNTHWSLVRRAAGAGPGTDESERREALNALLQRYQPALRSYLRVVRRMASADADDLLQSFIADRMLEHELLRVANEKRGRFRSLLLTSLNNYAASRHRAAARRPAVPLEQDVLAGASATPTTRVEAAWARALVHQTVEAMQQECESTGREDVWEVFRARVLAGVFGESKVEPYEALAKRLHLESPTQAANLLVTGKRMYARLLRASVAQYEQGEDEIEAELADLRRAVAFSTDLSSSAEERPPPGG